MTPTSRDVNFDQISPSNFCCGHILEGENGHQYIVRDVFGQPDNDENYAVLDLVPEDERVKPEFLDGRVQI